MQSLIELTPYIPTSDGYIQQYAPKIWINVSTISNLCKDFTRNSTRIELTNGNVHYVLETIDEILKMQSKLVRVSNENKEFEDNIIAQKVKDCVKDGYFNGLSIEQIFELARKSIRITKDNRDMTCKLEELLEKAKINGDHYYFNELKKILVVEDF